MRTTNMVKRTFQWFVDLQTSANNLTMLKVTAGGNNVFQRLQPFFAAFKYYKLGGVKIRLVPASTLPVDPTGLSIAAGEQTVDPRDQFNPGLIRITNGEDFWERLDDIKSSTNLMQVYNNMMLDQRWFKFQLQSGCKRFAKPKFWSIGQIHQDMFPGSVVNFPFSLVDQGQVAPNGSYPALSLSSARSADYGFQVMGADGTISSSTLTNNKLENFSSKYGLFQTGRKEPMGWLPTDSFVSWAPEDTGGEFNGVGGASSIPEIELMRIILPKAYKTIYYYRMFVEETVYFKAPVNYYADDGLWYGSLDRFLTPDGKGTGSLYPGMAGIEFVDDGPNSGDGKVEPRWSDE